MSSSFHQQIPQTKNRYLTFLLIVFSGFFVSLAQAQEPSSLYLAKQQLIRYHDSGEYDKDIYLIMQRALHYLQARLSQKELTGKRLAIVLDIDETALSNYPTMLKLGFGGSREEIRRAEVKALDPVIKPTLSLYQFAKANHVAVFFVTGRREDERQSTVQNLLKAGYREWDGLILKPRNYKLKSISFYKSAARKKLTDQGYHLVLNIGDQLSDLADSYAEKNYKLPNPFYYLA